MSLVTGGRNLFITSLERTNERWINGYYILVATVCHLDGKLVIALCMDDKLSGSQFPLGMVMPGT